ncbi:MAG: tRNA (adenosine(37)-N6)-threonylcarbamoyltransferase complex ATPase subunit type 1 TsaE [Oscillospiraceae bacterium]|nr:tRNA (adenosine(37)-N6)-threonylcarbamoyltransferase complex ATPase subunit type 1 TsaE [Ruminococcus sp.]MBQ9982356.1 tRNA (adenosine(37)-N6)-threonylcarbamoyltransferase complex ATPase subunit type 1 TsaE [Oscillospiraceae bacterium]MBR6599096.1 tRNA (adenosine(37)-N6)-threonylcarbamoyltransferase complex ATPase subunit type 1 TsaE [Oscillospiraceae bacterium]
MNKIITTSPEETIEFAKKIGAVLKKGDVIAYKGGLGAGKTTFTRGLAMGAGLEDEVYSPTFALINEYAGDVNIYHFDMYRIENTDDLETTGFFDYPMEDSIFVIEWSENIIDALPENTIFIQINRIDDETREIIIEGDERFADIRN